MLVHYSVVVMLIKLPFKRCSSTCSRSMKTIMGKNGLGVEHVSFGGISVSDFVFSCGTNNTCLFGGVSGLMGLGRSNLSLISQTNTTFEGVFLYCLPTENGASSSLVIDNDSSIFKNLTRIAYTNMVSSPQLSNFYILNLNGINIGDVTRRYKLGNGCVLNCFPIFFCING
ncbi:aspartyl protease AED1-like [Vicia villosa]|uniref:aspartyl protease AED1-like n=1 Tax=Vicia villosa TaxID=3911 RepID=UPI00273BDCD1|nr:aspartyl protease AED1-like [Vicia villosa]